MAKRRFQLTTKEAQELKGGFQQSKDGPTRSRYQAVWMYGANYPVSEIKAVVGCSRSSLMNWCRAYQEAGADGLVEHRMGGNSAKLSAEQTADLRRRLESYTPQMLYGPEAATPTGQFWTVEDLQRVVMKWYGVAYQSRTSYLNLFARCGFSYQRTEKVFTSRRPSQVAAFEEQLEKN